jgi:hypothetical protein
VTVTLTWDQVLAWRMRRQFLDPPAAVAAVDVVRRLAGVQAQVASAAELAVAVRQAEPRPGEVAEALAGGTLMKTWAMRGTLHLLPPDEAGAYLSLMAAGRAWELPRWQKVFGVSPSEMDALAEIVADVLDGAVLSREDLADAIIARTGSAHLREQLRSGWGVVFKPLAFQGHLCQGPAEGNRVTFTRPDTWLRDWGGVPEPEAAAAVVIAAYLGAHGPASANAFDRWLTRGTSKKAMLRGWFAALGDALVEVEVDGEPAYARAEDVDDLATTKPTRAVRLAPGFDQYVLGPGTQDTQIIPPGRRPEVSKTGGWISPVVLARGRVAGVWEIDGDTLAVRLFDEAGRVARRPLQAEAKRLAGFLDRKLKLQVSPPS